MRLHSLYHFSHPLSIAAAIFLQVPKREFGDDADRFARHIVKQRTPRILRRESGHIPKSRLFRQMNGAPDMKIIGHNRDRRFRIADQFQRIAQVFRRRGRLIFDQNAFRRDSRLNQRIANTFRLARRFIRALTAGRDDFNLRMMARYSSAAFNRR